MPPSDIVLTTQRPKVPKTEFAFCIDFRRGEGSPSRVFSATHEFIKTCERLDRELVTSIDANIEAVMVLEDIEAGSIKTRLRNVINSVDDQALRNLDWRLLVGEFLVRVKYCILNWINKEEDEPRDLLSLGRKIQDLADEMDVQYIQNYTPISSSVLMNAVKGFENVKKILSEEDKASFLTSYGELEINLKIKINIKRIEARAVKETQICPIPSKVLIVKKPDYLGSSMWDFKYGQQAISAKIEDNQWLKEFQDRKVDIRPGDALRCDVWIETLYGHDNELIREKFYIKKVHSVERHVENDEN